MLRWVARGLTNKEIAYRLGLSERTVQFHLNSVFNKTTTNSRLPDGTQFVAALPPTAVNGPCCVIQKFAVGTNLTWEALVANHSLSAEAQAFLAHTVASGINVLATGNASSGITTVAGLLVDLVPADRRVVVVEERLELHPKHPNLVRLVADQPGGPTFAQLMELAAHMHAHRLAFGELTGPETLKAMHILSRGYGGITFMHAENALEALGRLETFCLMANLGLGLDEIRRMIAAAIKLVTFQANHVLPHSNRKIVEMTEVQGVEDGRYVLQPIFRYDPATATWNRLAQASWEIKPD